MYKLLIGLSDECLLPMDFGYCRAKVKRYYFDIRRMKCSLFYWGGCAGNQNNFKSLEECNKYCSAAYEDNNYQSSPTTASTPPTLQHHRERGEREREREQSNHNQRIDSNVNRYDLTNYNYNQNYFNSNKNNNNNYNNRINAYPQRTGNIIKSNSKSNIGYKNKAYPGNYSNYNASVAGGITPSGSFGSVSSSAASYSKIYKPSAYASRASTEAKEVLEGVAEEDNDEDLNGEYDN